jgi:hypothetical protein
MTNEASETTSLSYREQRDALALVISNAYRARHGMPPILFHAAVDESIADAILAAGWTPPADAGKSLPYTEDDKLAVLNEALEHGVGSHTSPRAKQVREIAEEIMAKHHNMAGVPHAICAKDSKKVWPCVEYRLAREAMIYAGGKVPDEEVSPF